MNVLLSLNVNNFLINKDWGEMKQHFIKLKQTEKYNKSLNTKKQKKNQTTSVKM